MAVALYRKAVTDHIADITNKVLDDEKLEAYQFLYAVTWLMPKEKMDLELGDIYTQFKSIQGCEDPKNKPKLIAKLR